MLQIAAYSSVVTILTWSLFFFSVDKGWHWTVMLLSFIAGFLSFWPALFVTTKLVVKALFSDISVTNPIKLAVMVGFWIFCFDGALIALLTWFFQSVS